MSKILLTFIVGVLIPLSFVHAENAAIRRAYDEQQAERESCESNGGTFKPGEGCQLSGNEESSSESSSRSENRSSLAQEDSTPPGGWGAACKEATESAVFGCDVDENPTVKTTMEMAKMLKAKLENDVSTTQGAICSQMGNLSKQLNLAHTAYSAFCTKGYISCQNACSGDIQAIRAAMATGAATQLDLNNANIDMRRCQALSGNLMQAKESLEKYANVNAMKAQACKQAVSNAIPGTGADSPACQANPASAECLKAMTGSTDCSDPNSTNLVCVCSRRPSDPQCMGAPGGFGPMGRTAGSPIAAGSADALGNFGGLNGDGSGSGFGSNIQAVKPNAGGGQPMGGRGGGGGGGGGGGPSGGSKGAAAGAGGGGAAGSGYNTKLIAGYGVGGRGGGGAGAGRGGAGAGGRPGYGMPGQKPGQGHVDLRQFLPGGRMDPSRGLAGISGPDGITGPNSNIWKKINARYFSVQPSLLP